jgi:hypothetical protein
MTYSSDEKNQLRERDTSIYLRAKVRRRARKIRDAAVEWLCTRSSNAPTRSRSPVCPAGGVSGGPEGTLAAEDVLDLFEDAATSGSAFFPGLRWRDIILAD